MAYSVKTTSTSRLSKIDFKNLGFGDQFSDHQLKVHFADGAWKEPLIEPYGPFEAMPAMSALHYGQAVFEGLKAFRYKDGKVNLFRIEQNYERMAASCERLAMAIPEKEFFIEGIKQLVNLDRAWVPEDTFKSLYVRPFIFATDPVIRLTASSSYTFMVITGPVGNYYKEGINPVSLTTMPEYVRAVRGGIGAAKTAGNYAASLKPARLAQEKGFTQVLWLDALENKYIEEVGTMNIFFVIGDTLVTPKLSGSILPGITRRTVLQLAKDWNMKVEERALSIDEVFEQHENGNLKEVFGAGTAAVISPVGKIHHEGKTIHISETMGELASKFYKTITDIHHGDAPDPHDWCTLI